MLKKMQPEDRLARALSEADPAFALQILARQFRAEGRTQDEIHSFFESQLHTTRFTGSDQDLIKNVMAYVADGLPARWTGR